MAMRAQRPGRRRLRHRAVNDIGLAYATDEGRTTTTRIESFPNLPGTYAEQVKLTLDFRHIDPARFQAMRTEIDAAIAAGAKRQTSGSKSRKAGAGAPNCSPPNASSS